MKTATIRQVRNDFGALLQWIAAGEEVTILNRTRPVARLLPPRSQAPEPTRLPDFTARAKAIFQGQRTRLCDAILQEREEGR